MKFSLLLGIAVGILAASCSSLPPHSVTPASLKHDQIIVVGKLTVTPGIQSISFKGDVNPNIQPESAGTIEQDGQYFWVYLTPSKKVAEANLSSGVTSYNAYEFAGDLASTKSVYDYALNRETMILPAPEAKVLYIVGFKGSELEFPANYTVQVPEGAKAIYVGTFAFTRNKYFEITGYKHIDEYDQALADFQKVFPGMDLVRADLAPTKAPDAKQ